MTVSPRLDPWLRDYGSHHRTRGNRVTHVIGIPILMVAILGLLSLLEVGAARSFPERLDAGRLLWLVAVLWYVWLDWRLGLPFGVVGGLLYVTGAHLPWPVLLTLFVAGWVLQYLGHVVWEKRHPAFHRNLAHLLIGPLWVFAEVVALVRAGPGREPRPRSSTVQTRESGEGNQEPGGSAQHEVRARWEPSRGATDDPPAP